MEKLLLRPADVAEMLGLGRTRIYTLIAAKQIPSVRIGRSVRVPLDSLRGWIEQRAEGGGGA